MILEIEHLNKAFGKVKAVDDLSFHVKEGELFAFLGINGAGKSTTINIMCGQLSKDSGKVFVDGEDIDKNSQKIKSQIGVVYQNSVLDKALSVKDNLQCRAALYGINGKEFKDKLEELADILDFKDLLKRTVGKLSGGQRRRIDIARALLHDPKILILDEPTTGLDPQTRKTLWNVIERLQEERKMTVFLTTHYMEEAADADYVIILDSGRLIAQGTPLELKNQYTGDFVTLYGVTEEQMVQFQGKCRQIGIESVCTEIKDGFKIALESTAQVAELIGNNKELFKDFEVTKGKMDDVFLAVTGKTLGGDNK